MAYMSYSNKKSCFVKVLERTAMVLGAITLISGCTKVGKGPRINVVNFRDNTGTHQTVVDDFAPWPTMADAETDTTTTTTATTTTTTSEDTLRLVVLGEIENSMEGYVEVDATEAYSEEGLDGYSPSETTLNHIEYYEFVWLCNAVGTEYGSDWIDTWDKAQVVDTIMTRVQQGCWTDEGRPSTIYNVLTASGQFDWSYVDDYFHDNVTPDCVEAVNYYFAHMDEFEHYDSFYGDGVYNYFYNQINY